MNGRQWVTYAAAPPAPDVVSSSDNADEAKFGKEESLGGVSANLRETVVEAVEKSSMTTVRVDYSSLRADAAAREETVTRNEE